MPARVKVILSVLGVALDIFHPFALCVGMMAGIVPGVMVSVS